MPSEWHRTFTDYLRRTIITLISPALRVLPPWWKVRIYMHLIGSPFQQGGYSGKVKRRKVSPHCYEMELFLDDWMERFAYFVGCYYEIDATFTLLSLLRRGDRFIDVGANLGFLTLTASRAVGPEGKVLAFEPNKNLADRLNRTLLSNRIHNVIVYQHALGDIEGEATLDLNTHSGTGSLRHIVANGMKVDVFCGDRFISEIPDDGYVFAKLDVEGYELRVLKGFQSLIKRKRTGFLIEVTENWLMETGGSSVELFDLMMVNGFKAYLPKLTPFSKFKLHNIESPIVGLYQYDVVFIRPEDGWFLR